MYVKVTFGEWKLIFVHGHLYLYKLPLLRTKLYTNSCFMCFVVEHFTNENLMTI